MFEILCSFFKKYRFKSRMFFDFVKYCSFQFLVFFVIIVISVVFIVNKSNVELETENNNQVQRIENVLNITFYQINRIASSLCIDTDVKQYVYGKNDLLNENLQKKLVERLIYYKKITDYIDSIYIYSPGFQRICTTNTLFYDEQQYNEFNDYGFLEWLKENMKGDTITVPRKIENRYPRVISFVKMMDDGGYIIINIGYERFIDSLKISFDRKTEIFILNSLNEIVFPEYGTEADVENINAALESENGSYLDKLTGQMFSHVTIGYYQQRFVIKSDMSEFLNSKTGIILIALLALLVFLIVSVFAAAFLSFSSFKIVIKLQNVLDNKLLNLNDIPDNEEKHIIVEIIKLMDDNRAFKEKLDEILSRYKEAQVMALQKQINPHFLNNILSTISYKIVENDGVEAPALKMIVMLTRIINYGFNTDTIMVPLSKEIDFIKVYINILKTEYGDFEFVTDIEDSVLKHRVLRLSIQPFIENAVYHGISKMNNEGRVVLSAKKYDEKCVVVIEDNGIGISSGKIREINELIENGGGSEHVGIYNVYQRMKMIYPDDCSLKYESDGISGTRVILTTPFLENDNESSSERN